MSVLAGLFEEQRHSDTEERAKKIVYGHPSAGQIAWLDEGVNTAGERVNYDTALSLDAVYACVNSISEDVAKLPLITYRRLDPRGKERVPGHPVYDLLHTRPNPEMTAIDFRQAMTAHVLLRGNGYAEIEQAGGGRPKYLWLLRPDRVAIKRGENEKIYYEVTSDSGGVRIVPERDMLHIRGLGFDGYVGYSVVTMGARSMGSAMAADSFAADFFANAGVPAGVARHPGELSTQAKENIISSFEAKHAGSGKRHRLAVFEEAMEYDALTISPEDSQLLETRQASVPVICRWFRMKPHKVADLMRATYSNIEEESLAYVTDTLLGWLIRWEQWCNIKLFPPGRNIFCEHLVDGLLRGKIKARYEAYAIGITNKWLLPDEVREFENMNPLPEQPEPEPEPEEGEDDDRARLVDAQRGLLLDLCGRIVRKESRAMNKAANAPDTFQQNAEAFYAKHAEYMCSVLEPAIRACGASLNGGATAEELSAYLAKMSAEYISKSKADLAGVRNSELGSMEWVKHWDMKGRADILANRILKDISSDVLHGGASNGGT